MIKTSKSVARMTLRVAASALVLGTIILPAQADDLTSVLRAALDNDPQYRAAVYRSDAESEVVAQARANLLPQVGVTAGVSQTNQEIISSDNSVFAVGENDYGASEANLGMDLSIFSYSQYMNLGRAKQERARAMAELDAAQQDLFLRVADRYFTALGTIELLQHVRAEKRALSEHLELAEAKSSGGLSRRADAMDARARYLESAAWEIEVQVQLTDALQALSEIAGSVPLELDTLPAKVVLTPPEDMNSDHWVAQALEHNPRLVAAEYAANAAHKEVRRQIGEYFPELDLNVDYDYRDTDGTLFGGGSETETATAMVNVRMPLFTGMRRASRLREARSLLNARKQEGVQIQREIERRTITSLQNVNVTLSKIEALDASVQAQEMVVESLRTAYRNGTAKSVELLDAERELFSKRVQWAQARYDGILSELRLKHSVGLLTAADIENANTMLTGDPVSIAVLQAGE